MENEAPSSTPIACQLRPGEQAEHEASLRNELFTRLLGTTELDDGYAYQFPGEDEVLRQLTDFVLFERQCCTFFTFDLTIEPEQGPVTLKLRGPGGTKALLERMGGQFSLQTS